MQVVAVSTPGRPAWHWRIVDYAGAIVEESRETFASIGAALASGAKMLREMNIAPGPVPPASLRPRSRFGRAR